MKFEYKLSLLVMATTAFSMLQQRDSKAGITYCNRTNETISIVHAHTLNLRTLRTTGWWKLVPGACKEVYIGPAFDVIKEAGQADRVRMHIYHALSSSGRRWGNGRKDICVTQSAFQFDQFYDSLRNGADQRPCPGGYSKQRFVQVQVRRENETVYLK